MARPAITVLVLSCAMAALIVAPASASQSIASSQLAATAPVAGRLHVDLQVKRFVARAAQTKAQGVVTATLKGINSAPTTVRQRVLLQVTRGRTCTILTLTLNQLNLQLLGVTVHLDRVHLTVTGRRRGGVLGRLFCSLAGARVTPRAAAVRSLNRGLREQPMHPMRFTVTARPAQAAATCQILDLVLGPLHLDLLGLVVDLNRVHLSITGDPAGGILGRLLCGLANTPTPALPVR
jgi:hypothetical protein